MGNKGKVVRVVFLTLFVVLVLLGLLLLVKFIRGGGFVPGLPGTEFRVGEATESTDSASIPKYSVIFTANYLEKDENLVKVKTSRGDIIYVVMKDVRVFYSAENNRVGTFQDLDTLDALTLVEISLIDFSDLEWKSFMFKGTKVNGFIYANGQVNGFFVAY